MAVDLWLRCSLWMLGGALLAACGSAPSSSDADSGLAAPSSAAAAIASSAGSAATSAVATSKTAAVDVNTTQISVNSPPTITGIAKPLAVVGERFSFTPSASDADGNALTFTVQHLPQWLALNSATGEISGTPAAADIGVYGDLQITVSDGIASSTLSAFSITVLSQQSLLGAVRLSWQAPTANTDGSPLLSLSGYKIVYGLEPDALAYSTQLSDSETSCEIENLMPGTWYFAVIAITSGGMESAMSDVVSKTIG